MGFTFFQQLFIELLLCARYYLSWQIEENPALTALCSAGIIGVCVCIILFHDNFVIHWNIGIYEHY